MEGKIILAELPQADGQTKIRPALVLRMMPPFNDYLVCGISSQLHQTVQGFDEVLRPSAQNGLRVISVVRLGFLLVLPTQRIKGVLGEINDSLRRQMIERLTDYLIA